MKAISILIIFILYSFNSKAWDFISTCGAATDETIWSIGGYGSIILTSTDQQVILTQGFLQPTIFHTSRVEHPFIAQTKIYPNPVVDVLSIQSENTLTCWTLFDAAGKEIAHCNINPALHTTINFGNYPKGYYTLSLHSVQGQTIVKVIK